MLYAILSPQSVLEPIPSRNHKRRHTRRKHDPRRYTPEESEKAVVPVNVFGRFQHAWTMTLSMQSGWDSRLHFYAYDLSAQNGVDSLLMADSSSSKRPHRSWR
jgi:hypothetical protein